MAYPKFFDQFIRPEPSGEVLSDEVVVERAGYIPAKEQIEGMIMAGLRLGEFRREAFDYASEEEDDGVLDPMRQNPDLAEVSELEREVNERPSSRPPPSPSWKRFRPRSPRFRRRRVTDAR